MTARVPDSDLVAVFNALAHPARLEILEILREGEACVCHIQAMLEQRQAYVSQHLNVLKQAGLVTSRKEGLRVYYQVRDPHLFGVVDEMKEIQKIAGDDRTAHQESYNERKKTCTCPQCTGEASCQPILINQVQYE